MSNLNPAGVVGFSQVFADRPWVDKFDRGWAIAVKGNWVEGYYDSPETAFSALYDFGDDELATLRPIWREAGENRPVTMIDLDTLSRSLPLPWYWRFPRLRRAVLLADQRFPNWLKPWAWPWQPPRH